MLAVGASAMLDWMNSSSDTRNACLSASLGLGGRVGHKLSSSQESQWMMRPSEYMSMANDAMADWLLNASGAQ